MIRIDLTGHAITVEGDGNLDHFITIRTLQTDGTTSRVARFDEEWNGSGGGRQTALEETARSRSGVNVLREYDIDNPGVYVLTSGRRELSQNRTFFMRVSFTNDLATEGLSAACEMMNVTILPGSALCPWVVEDDLHHYQTGETFEFSVRYRLQGVPHGNGEITRIESDQAGVKFERSTAWERLLEDDTPDSV